jgi:predicted RNA-binding Zn-ribbon protein involved in translation (DUF1610 family)
MSTYSCACGRYTSTECDATGAACPDCGEKVNATVKDRLTAARNVNPSEPARKLGRPPWSVSTQGRSERHILDADGFHIGRMDEPDLARAVVIAINSVHSGERLTERAPCPSCGKLSRSA